MTSLGRVSAPRFALGVLLLALVLRVPALVRPIIDTDEAGHGVGARELLRGGRLYVDYADNKPPLLYWIYTGVMAVGGRSVLAVHWFGLAWILVGASATGSLLRRTGFGLVEARWATLAYVVGSSVYLPNDMLATNGEQLMNPFLVLAALAWWRQPESFVGGLFAGILAFAGGCCYQKGWVMLPVLALWAAWRALSPRRLRCGPSGLVGLAVGSALSAGAVAWVLARQGVLAEALEWNFASNARYIRAGQGILSFSLEDRQPHGTVRVLFYLAANLLPLSVIVRGVRTREAWPNGRMRSFLLLWLAASFAALSLGGRYFGHYFLQTVPAWSALFGASAPSVLSALDRQGLRRLLWKGLPLAGLAVFSHVWVAAGGLESQHPLLRDLARHAATHSAPHERIFVWGYASPVYYFSARQPGTRFVYPQTLAGYVPGLPASLNQETDPMPFVVWKNWDLALRDLEEKKPVLIYDTAPSRFHYWGKFPVKKYPLAMLLEAAYAPIDTIRGVVVYRLYPSPREESTDVVP